MKRRRPQTTNSLDMLLDALCNMFGGIIFIALLIAIMSSDQTTPDLDASQGEPTRQKHALEFQLELILDELQAFSPAPAAWEELSVALDEQALADARIAKIKQISDRLQSNTHTIEEKIQDAHTEVQRAEAIKQLLTEKLENPDEDTLGKAIEDEQMKIEQLELDIRGTARRRTINAQLVRERKINKKRVFLWVSGDRVWLVNADATLDHAIDFDDYEKRDVTLKTEPGLWIYTPIPTGGFPVTDTIERHPRFRELVRTFPRREYYIHIVVAPDGHASFALLKSALLKNRYGYNIDLTDGDDDLPFHHGDVQGSGYLDPG